MPGPDPFYGLQPDFAANLRAFMGAAPMPLSIVSGYRSPERQAELFSAAVQKYGSPEAARKWVAPPGHSMHNLGEAVDLGYGGGLGSGPASLIDWAHQNAAKYNLAFPMSYENWHIEPIGARGRPAAAVNAPDMTSPSSASDPGSAEGAVAAPPLKTWMDYLQPQQQFNGSNDPFARLFAGQNPFGDNPLRTMVFGALGKLFA